MVSLGKLAERWGFPYDPVLFSLSVNFYRLKLNIFSVRRPQDKVTAVLFDRMSSDSNATCSWQLQMLNVSVVLRNSYCENPVN